VGIADRRTVAGYEKAAPANRGGQSRKNTSSEHATTRWCGAHAKTRRGGCRCWGRTQGSSGRGDDPTDAILGGDVRRGAARRNLQSLLAEMVSGANVEPGTGNEAAADGAVAQGAAPDEGLARIARIEKALRGSDVPADWNFLQVIAVWRLHQQLRSS
jgi:hypothetical protein